MAQDSNTKRPPIVAVLGHVDHGKTTLLDFVRKSNVQIREAGGITQSIGASQITDKEGRKITFIDTPGHAAFADMRGRGAEVADVIILVVAGNDGVKPQTVEAIGLANASSASVVVAVSKSDLSSSDPENVKNQLVKEGVKLEDVGGSVPAIAVSGKTGKGMNELMEMVYLVYDLKDIKSDPNNPIEAVVIENDKDKRGLLVSAVLRDGTLKIGDEISSGGIAIKVRGIFDYLGNPVKQVFPGDPVQILGFSNFPPVGSNIVDTAGAHHFLVGEKRNDRPQVEEGQVGLLLKAASVGSLEALIGALPKGAVVIYSDVGDVIESDVFMAKSAGVDIYAFEAKVSGSVNKLADTEDVKVKNYSIIYELIEDLNKMIRGEIEEVAGKAEVLALFPFNNRKVAGSRMVEGKITKNDTLVIERGGKRLGKAKIVSMKKEKKDVPSVSSGEEFGLILDTNLDFALGDMLISLAK